jgi:Spy/CpxP family protein refolding chaperone
MSRTKLLTVAIIALLLLNFGTLAFMFLHKPGRQGGPPDGAGEGPKYIIMARLHFNQTQQQQYSDMVEEHRSKSRELRGKSRQLHDELYELLKAETVDETRKNELINQIAGNQKEIENLNIDHFGQIKSLCKGVQVDQFNQLVDDLGHLFAPGPPPK